jgi:hypothetical protein
MIILDRARTTFATDKMTPEPLRPIYWTMVSTARSLFAKSAMRCKFRIEKLSDDFGQYERE